MAFFVRDCVRCGVNKVQHSVAGGGRISAFRWEVVGRCYACTKLSVYLWDTNHSSITPHDLGEETIDNALHKVSAEPVRIAVSPVYVSEYIPERIAGLFREGNECRQMTYYEAAGAMFRKTIDVATRHIYSTDERLQGKIAAEALRVRIKSLGEMKVLESDIVELADIVALDGNDAAHDVDPYTKGEAEALEELTSDLLERLFVRPARVAAVRAKQIEAGVRRT